MAIRLTGRWRSALVWLCVGTVVLAAVGQQAWFFLVFTYLIATTPRPNWDVVVAHGSDCQLRDDAPLSNHRGVVAVVREANCPGDFAQGTEYDVVFVHTRGERNTTENLAFQYTPGFEGYVESPLPELVWKDATSLQITAPGVIEDIKVQKSEVGGVRVTYLLGRRLWP